MPVRPYLCLFLWLASLSVLGQSRTIRGTVIDETNQPRPGVSLHWRGLTNGTETNAKGQFTLTSPPGSVTLIVSAIGYLRQEIPLKPRVDSLTIRLLPDTRTLDEVVVVGYATSEKRAMTGSVGTVGSARPAPATTRVASVPGRSESRTVTLYKGTPAPAGQAGQLTAGEIHDYSNWTLWQDIAANELTQYRTLWHQAPTNRYSVQVSTADGFPLVDVPLRLLSSQRQVVWQTRTDNTGRGELWASLFLTGNKPETGKLTVETVVAGKTYTLNRPHAFGRGHNTLTVEQPCQGTAPVVDVAFVVDATGSMGDEMAYLSAELTDVIAQTRQAVPNRTIRVGSVFYRDHHEAYLTRHQDFTAQPDSAVAFIKQQQAGGGGDYPEAVDTALAVALTQLSWSKQATTRLLFLVLDAPPHNDELVKASLQRSVARAAEMGIRLIPVAASGIDKSTEYLLRSMALGTNGTYVFLTDDSGIGNPHIKPTTDQYTVEKLNDLLVRLITKFTQTPDCRPVASTAVRYAENGQPVGVPDLLPTPTTEPRFRYFPNPTRDYLTIENPDPIRELLVMDVTGKVILRELPDEPTVRLNMLPYPTGTYLFRFRAAQTGQTGRFLLNK